MESWEGEEGEERKEKAGGESEEWTDGCKYFKAPPRERKEGGGGGLEEIVMR